MAIFKLEKDMYKQARLKGQTFSELLADAAPSQMETHDAFEFQLHERDINLKKDTVERFYRTTEDAILFPEFINRNIRIGLAGLTGLDLSLDDIVATTTTIDSGVYDSVNAAFVNKDLDFKRVGEGAQFPTVTITTSKNSIRLAKLGVKLESTYEVLRRMKLPLLAIHIQLIGQRIAKKNVAYAMHNIINGDGNNNAAPATNAAALSYAGLFKHYLSMDEFTGTVMAARSSDMESIFNLDEFKNAQLFDTAKTGNLPTPFGLPLKRFNWTETALGTKLVPIIAKNAALEMIKESGAELIETDKVIEKQIENTVISNVIGFSRIFTNAAKVYTIQ